MLHNDVVSAGSTFDLSLSDDSNDGLTTAGQDEEEEEEEETGGSSKKKKRKGANRKIRKVREYVTRDNRKVFIQVLSTRHSHLFLSWMNIIQTLRSLFFSFFGRKFINYLYSNAGLEGGFYTLK